jgi:hypothetical protein
MDQLMKWTLLFAALMMVDDFSHAFSIGSKGRANGPSIHTTYFLTPQNAQFPVKAQVLAGSWLNGYCIYQTTNPIAIGTELLKTGDFIDIDAYLLREIIGSGYDCLALYYTYNQLVIESFQILWDGFNYRASFPPLTEVSIL